MNRVSQAVRALVITCFLVAGILTAVCSVGCVIESRPAEAPATGGSSLRCVVDENGETVCIVQDDGLMLRHVGDVHPYHRQPQKRDPQGSKPIGGKPIGDQPPGQESEPTK